MEPVTSAAAGPHWLEVCFWLSQIFLTGIAAGTAYFGYQQLKEINESRHQQTKISHATLMMQLDTRWDSTEMQEARKIFEDIYEKNRKLVSASYPLASDQDKEARVQEEWKKTLSDYRNNNKEDYGKLISICGFFETVGMMVTRKYISLEDASSLFKGSIITMGRNFGGHIEDRSKEMGVPRGLYENALELYEMVRKTESPIKT